MLYSHVCGSELYGLATPVCCASATQFDNLAGPYVSAREVWAVKEKCAATIQRFTRGWLARRR